MAKIVPGTKKAFSLHIFNEKLMNQPLQHIRMAVMLTYTSGLLNLPQETFIYT